MSHLFELILESDQNIEFSVKVSFLELYNEKLNDLLDRKEHKFVDYLPKKPVKLTFK